MAENVHHWTEQMLPELEQMQRVNLFTSREVKAIIKKRTAHEYKLVRRIKDKKDFLAYIQYEISLLDLIHKRRKRENYYFKKEEIEFAILTRIHRLFKQATLRWAGDLKLWFSHAQFCIKWNKRVQLSKLCTRLLQVHGNKPKVWVLAAKWQLECSDSIEGSRAIFLQALKNFPVDHYIWLEYFRAELLYLEKTKSRLYVLSGERGGNIDESMGQSEAIFLKGGAVKIVYNNAMKAISEDADFHINLMEVASLFTLSTPCAETIVQDIACDLKKKYSKNAKALAAVAKLPMKQEIDSKSAFVENEMEKRESLCCQEFEKALKSLDTPEVWGEYFDFLDTIYREGLCQTWERLNESRKSRFFVVAYNAHKSRKLSFERTIIFVDRLLENGSLEEALEVITQAYDWHPDVGLLTSLTKISILVAESDVAQVDKNKLYGHFLDVELSDNKDALEELGTVWLQQSIIENNVEMAKQVLKCVVKNCGRDESIDCQEMYWKWIAGTRGIGELHQVFKESIPVLQKPSIKQYRSLLNVITGFNVPEVVFQIYESALEDHGRSDPSLWIEYIKLKQSQGGKGAVDAGKIYWRAMKSLEPASTEQFITNYALLNL